MIKLNNLDKILKSRYENYLKFYEEIKKNKVNKKTIITIVFLGLILIALIVVGVVIYNGTK